MVTRRRGDPADHTLKPLYRKRKKFPPSLIGYECIDHGEIMTASLQPSTSRAIREHGQYASPRQWFPNKRHKARLKAAGRLKKGKKKDDGPEDDSKD